MGGTVDGLLSGRGGVDGGHQTLDDTVLVVDDLGERGQAVGCAGSVGDDGVLGVVSIQVDAANEHWGISGRSGDDDLFGAALQVGRGPTEKWSEDIGYKKSGLYLSMVVKTPVDSTM